MSIFSTAESVLKQIFNKEFVQSNQTRKEDAWKRLRFYHDDQSEYIFQKLNDHFKDPQRFDIAFVNIVKKIINNLATTYVQQAKREIVGSERDNEIYEEIIETSGLHAKMKLVSRYTKLLKTLMVRPVWRRGIMDYDIVTPDLIDVQYGDTPEDLQSVLITHYPESGKQEEIEFSLWTASEFKRLDYRGQEIESQPNPYQVIPYTAFFDRVPIDEFWLSGGDDLIVMQEAINAKITELIYTLRLQGFGMPYTKGLGHASEISFDAGTAIDLPIEGDLGFASTNSPIEAVVKAIDFLIKQAVIMNGLSASVVSTEETEQSGISRLIMNKELAEMRADDLALFNIYEKRLFALTRVVWNVHNPGRQISTSANLKIDFYDPKPEEALSERVIAWNELLNMKVISRVDIVMELNKDLETREEALEYLDTVLEENRKYSDNDDEFNNRLNQELLN